MIENIKSEFLDNLKIEAVNYGDLDKQFDHIEIFAEHIHYTFSVEVPEIIKEEPHFEFFLLNKRTGKNIIIMVNEIKNEFHISISDREEGCSKNEFTKKEIDKLFELKQSIEIIKKYVK